jgi:hypothetical protein
MSRWDLPRWFMAVSASACLVAASAALPPSTQSTPPSFSAGPEGRALPATAPTALPTTSRSPDANPLPFPNDCNVLLARSIFARGGRGAGAVATTGPATRPASPEAGFVLRGVASQGPVRTALLEDLHTHNTRQLHIGDDVIGGKVVAITMDGLDRTLGGRMLHVGVGQPIDGSAPPPGIAVAAASGPPSTTQPAAAGDASPPTIFAPAPAPPPVPGAPVQASLKIIETK